jgi:hypothetical protein
MQAPLSLILAAASGVWWVAEGTSVTAVSLVLAALALVIGVIGLRKGDKAAPLAAAGAAAGGLLIVLEIGQAVF